MMIIGEKINGTLDSIKPIIVNRDEDGLLDLAERQVVAGADYIDVNVGTGIGSRADEVQSIQWAVRTIQRAIPTPLCIDSADPLVIEAGLEAVAENPAIINSVKAEAKSLKAIVPLAAQYQAHLIALAMDESGIPKTVKERLHACEIILECCEKSGLSAHMLYFDPLVMPISTDIKSGQITLQTLSAIKKSFPEAKTVTGLSNVSYGLPARSQLNIAFMHMCIYAGLDAAIVDPLDEALMLSVKTGEVLAGKDRHCRRYTRAFRKQNPV